MSTKRNTLSTITFGLSVSVLLAVIYTLVMIASLLLVGLGTTVSRQAFFLGIGWRTIIGFEFGFLGVGIVAFAAALVFVPTYNACLRLIPRRPKTVTQTSHVELPITKSWQVRLLIACLVLPALVLVTMRAVASSSVLEATTADIEAARQTPGLQMRAVPMGSEINTEYREAEPSFTNSGRTMYFNCNNGDICVSHLFGTWEQGSWSPPERLEAPISTEYEEVEPVINALGDKLFFTSRRPAGGLWRIPFLSPLLDLFRVVNTLATTRLGRSFFGGLGLTDVYVSYWIDGAWSEPRNLNDVDNEPPINTEFADHCLFFSADGNEAFWTSTRPGGFGGNDIWTSRRVGGKWTEPENLGSNVNGVGDEHTSILTPDGRSLYVTATRPEGFGKEDIYLTTRNVEGSWDPLVNLGPMVNGPGDDRCPAWTPDFKIFLFDSVREGGFGSRDIWWIYFKDVLGSPETAVSFGVPY